MLNPSSRIKGEKDWQKYETARRLKKCVDKIRNQYREDWKSKEMKVRQRAVALYFIDKLALRAGNEKEEGETADTVGCCSLRVEHINLHPELDGQEYVVEFDFLGKDSIRYYNKVPVEKRVFKNLQLFMENKQPEDDLFDRLNVSRQRALGWRGAPPEPHGSSRRGLPEGAWAPPSSCPMASCTLFLPWGTQ